MGVFLVDLQWETHKIIELKEINNNMAYVKNGGDFGASFNVTSQSILDNRLTVATLNDLVGAYSNGNYYPYMIVTVENEKAQYMLVNVANRDIVSGSNAGWMKLTSTALFDNNSPDSIDKKLEVINNKLKTVNELAKFFEVKSDGMDFVANPVLDCGTF